MSAANYLTAWILFILILLLIVKTRVGQTIAYYLLWMAVIYLLISHYQEITNIFQAGGIIQNG